jgi:hypothetical protein
LEPFCAVAKAADARKRIAKVMLRIVFSGSGGALGAPNGFYDMDADVGQIRPKATAQALAWAEIVSLGR